MRYCVFIALAVFAVCLPLTACEGGSRDGDDVAPAEVSAEQELEMCDILTASVSTGQIPKTTGPSIDDCAATDAQPGRKTIEFVEFDGQKGGFLRLTVDPSAKSPVFLMMDEDVPFAALHEDGSQVGFLEGGDPSDLCEEAGCRYLWVVADQTNYLRFGPTARTSVDMVIETVDTSDTVGE